MFKEIVTVIYEPAKITEDKMISALQKAHTYIGVAERNADPEGFR